jgi:hypothetical protein
MVLPSPGWGAGWEPGAHRAYLPRHQRASAASQWLYQEPRVLLRRSMATWCREQTGGAGGGGQGGRPARLCA